VCVCVCVCVIMLTINMRFYINFVLTHYCNAVHQTVIISRKLDEFMS